MPTQDQDRQDGSRPATLVEIFTAEPQTPIERKRPAVLRSYYGGSCQNPDCRADLGYIETDGGRDRKYCKEARVS